MWQSYKRYTCLMLYITQHHIYSCKTYQVMINIYYNYHYHHHHHFFLYFLCISAAQENCSPGFFGKNCRAKCSYPYFGENCQERCNCDESLCDVSTGCLVVTTGEQSVPFLLLKFTLIYSIP